MTAAVMLNLFSRWERERTCRPTQRRCAQLGSEFSLKKRNPTTLSSVAVKVKRPGNPKEERLPNYHLIERASCVAA